MSAADVSPFVVGQWVRGDRFYGRDAQITEILDGPRDSLWLLGTGRIGKTSLLKQIELLAESSPDRGDVPVFWDLQGADSRAELSRTFQDSLLDAQERLERSGFQTAEADDEDLFASFSRLRRHLESRRLRLLLLCDEADELIRLGRGDPALLRRLERTLQGGKGMRAVLASTIRLRALAEPEANGSPVLTGRDPPVILRALTDEEARSLILQTHLPPDSRPAIDPGTADRIAESSGGHPYLLQLLCKRTLELGSFEQAFEQIAADAMVAALFSSDFETLPEGDRDVLGVLGEETPAEPARLRARLGLDAETLEESLVRLEDLGLVRTDERQRRKLANPFLRRWVATRPRTWPRAPAAARATEIAAELSRVGERPGSSPNDLFEAVYDPLRQLAAHYLRRERPGHTLQPTALVHEAYLRLVDQTQVDWKGRTHFFAVGARIMRRVLIDHARSRRRAKRGGDWLRITLTGLAGPPAGGELEISDLLALHSALEKLARVDERQARVVELRFFAGLQVAEIAEALGVSRRTVDGDWAKARAWLERELTGWAIRQTEPDPGDETGVAGAS